jgi:transcriptional regulator with XRE-family HTH domain
MPERRRCPRIEAIDRHIGAQIRAQRRYLGLTLAQLAARLGITYQQLHRNELGLNHVPISRICDLAQCLDVTVDYFFDGLRDEQIVPLKHTDRRFLRFAEHFIRLDREDQRVLIGVTRVFSKRRERFRRRLEGHGC